MVKINNLKIKDYLSFKEISIDLEDKKSNLVLFTGASGVGKSVLMNGILSIFGIKTLEANMIDVSLNNKGIEKESFDIKKEDDIFIKGMKKSKVNYYLNDQNISKKNLQLFGESFIKHISLKNIEEFENENMLDFIDQIILTKNKKYNKTLEDFKEKYEVLKENKKELKKLIEEETKVEELKEFLEFEINKINKVQPTEEEYEELQEVKKRISQKDKVETLLSEVRPFVNGFSAVHNLLNEVGIETNETEGYQEYLEGIIYDIESKYSDLGEVNVEEVLDRISEISKIIKKYGSIEEMYKTLKEKEEELYKYEHITEERTKLEKKIQEIQSEVEELVNTISLERKSILKDIQNGMNKYLELLFLKNFEIKLNEKELTELGKDEVELILNKTTLNKISSGEFNRLRLSLLALKSDFALKEGGILFLDEIDANLSGKESEGIAELVYKLSFDYQIFSISHQPQLTSYASQHFLISKDNDVSTVKELKKDEEKINEIARMISGKTIEKEALEFATKLVKRKK